MYVSGLMYIPVSVKNSLKQHLNRIINAVFKFLLHYTCHSHIFFILPSGELTKMSVANFLTFWFCWY